MKLEVENLNIARKGFSLKDISFQVQDGAFFGIGGENGSGKTTLLKAIFGVTKAASGRIIVEGRDIYEMIPREIARKISYVPQETPLPMNLMVSDILDISSYSSPDRTISVEKAISICGISKYVEREFSTLSGGEKRLVMFAASIAQDSDIILMDEPTTFLDIEKRTRILSLMKNMKKMGKTIIGVFHELDILYNFCDSIILLKEGRCMGSGNPGSVMNEDTLRETFGVSFALLDTEFGMRFEPRVEA